MLLKITLDPSLDEEAYEDFEIIFHEIYAEVSSANSTKVDTKVAAEYYLKQCPIITDNFTGLPIMSYLTVFQESANLRCEWEFSDENGLHYISVKVRVEECDRFPKLRNGGQS